MKNFVMIGAAGYIAPRHMKAIKETGNNLIAAFDVNDSVGIIDSYFPSAEFFTEFEEFNSFTDDIQLYGKQIDYAVICSPNHLHKAHIKYALKNRIEVICEKPLVLNTSCLDDIQYYEKTYETRVNSILQLRLHPSIVKMREQLKSAPVDHVFDVSLSYLTTRGNWYMKSWKGDDQKSGGVATNIGVHFFDMLYFVFGEIKSLEVHYKDDKTVAGFLKYNRADVKWFLSIDEKYLPKSAIDAKQRTYRSITIDEQELEFSGGFTDLHTLSYQKILSGKGFGSAENKVAIETVEKIRQSTVKTPSANFHSAFRVLR